MEQKRSIKDVLETQDIKARKIIENSLNIEKKYMNMKKTPKEVVDEIMNMIRNEVRS